MMAALMTGEPNSLGDRNLVAEVDVLDCIENFNAFLHRSLEGFATGYQTGAAGALVDDGGGDCFFKVVLSGGPA